MSNATATARTFKTAWFAKAARKVRISDAELCEAIQEVMKGQADDLGGDELKEFRLLGKNLQKATDKDIAPLLADGRLTEICNGDQA